MNKIINLSLVLSLLSPSLVWSQTPQSEKKETKVEDLNVSKNDNFDHNVKDDAMETLKYMGKGSYMQFTEPSSLIMLGAAVAFFIPFWNSDKKASARFSNHKDHGIEGFASSTGVAANFPIIPMATYALARNNHDEKMVKFSQETAAATTLALIEASAISIIPLHPRPSPDNLSFLETAFRYESSFPSGHTVGWTVLTFKTFQYYGPWPALAPATMAYFASAERVKTDKHYLSDVIGSAVIGFMASEGVRAAANHQNNHPVYKWIFEHDLKVGFMYLEQKSTGTISVTF
ncbi:MAG: phosphatase PAP2 family protein [Bacteriovoracaceae bacterium]